MIKDSCTILKFHNQSFNTHNSNQKMPTGSQKKNTCSKTTYHYRCLRTKQTFTSWERYKSNHNKYFPGMKMEYIKYVAD